MPSAGSDASAGNPIKLTSCQRYARSAVASTGRDSQAGELQRWREEDEQRQFPGEMPVSILINKAQ